jgi:hypothetical protein
MTPALSPPLEAPLDSSTERDTAKQGQPSTLVDVPVVRGIQRRRHIVKFVGPCHLGALKAGVSPKIVSERIWAKHRHFPVAHLANTAAEQPETPRPRRGGPIPGKAADQVVLSVPNRRSEPSWG